MVRKTHLFFFIAFSFCVAKAEAVDADSRPVRVGVIIPLSGVLSEYGNAIRNAFELAKRDRSDAFRSLSLSFEDSQSDTKTAVSAFEKLAVEKVDAMFLWGTTPTEGVAPVAQAKGIPLIAMSISPTVAHGRPLVVRTVGPSSELVRPLTDYIRKSGFKNIALIKTEWSYTEELARALHAELGDAANITEMSVPKADMDFRSIILRINARSPDVVGVFLGAGQISSFYRQKSELKLNFPTFGDDFFASEKEIADSGPAIAGTVFSHMATCTEFTSEYRARFQSDTHIAYATNAYDIAVLLAEVAAEKRTSPDYFSRLTAAQKRAGICGEFQFRETEDFGKYFQYPIALYRVEGSKAVKIGG